MLVLLNGKLKLLSIISFLLESFSFFIKLSLIKFKNFSLFSSGFLLIWIVIYFPCSIIKSKVVPQHNNFPFFKIPIWSARNEASSIKCVIRIIIFFLSSFKFFKSFRIFQIFFLDNKSTPPVGSSKIITLLLPQHAIAIANLLFNPPDKFLTNLSLKSSNSKISINFLISASIFNFSFEELLFFSCSLSCSCSFSFFFSSYLNKQKISRFSLTVKSSNKILLFWGQTPKIFLNFLFPSLSTTSTSSLRLSSPYIIEPLSASINPLKMDIKVLFPAPFWPNNTKISFSYALKDKLSKALVSLLLYLLIIFFIFNLEPIWLSSIFWISLFSIFITFSSLLLLFSFIAPKLPFNIFILIVLFIWFNV